MAEATAPHHGREPQGERRGEADLPIGGPLSTGDGPGSPDPTDRADRRLDALAGQLRGDAAAQVRRRQQWLRRQAAEDSSVAGVLVDHAEHGSTLAVTTRSGSRHVGRVRGAGSALVTLDLPGGRVVIELDGIETFRALPTGSDRPLDPTGHRSRADDASMAEVLADAVPSRPEVTLVTRSGELVAGELVAVGRDLVMVRPPERGPLVYLPLASVSEALLPASTGSG